MKLAKIFYNTLVLRFVTSLKKGGFIFPLHSDYYLEYDDEFLSNWYVIDYNLQKNEWQFIDPETEVAILQFGDIFCLENMNLIYISDRTGSAVELVCQITNTDIGDKYFKKLQFNN